MKKAAVEGSKKYVDVYCSFSPSMRLYFSKYSEDEVLKVSLFSYPFSSFHTYCFLIIEVLYPLLMLGINNAQNSSHITLVISDFDKNAFLFGIRFIVKINSPSNNVIDGNYFTRSF